MAIEKVKEFFKKYNMESRIRELGTSSATVELAAEALHCEPCRIAKTLSFMVNGHPILIVAAGDAKIDNPKYKAQFGTKAKMLSPEEAETMVGHAVGGVCPFAVNDNVTVYLDESLKRFETVFPACGSSNSAIELTIEELEKYSSFVSWIDVCKEWRESIQ
ncbi:MAG: YbaK/EbsC family protein [Eubacteriales bacterium]